MRIFMRIVIGPIYQGNRNWMRMVMRIMQFFESSGKALTAQVFRVFREHQHTRRVAFVCTGGAWVGVVVGGGGFWGVGSGGWGGWWRVGGWKRGEKKGKMEGEKAGKRG